MTYTQAKKILDNMTQAEFDEYGVMLSKLHTLVYDNNHKLGDAIELALTAMGLYCKLK